MLLIPDVEAACRHNQFRPKPIYDGLRYARKGHVLKKKYRRPQ